MAMKKRTKTKIRRILTLIIIAIVLGVGIFFGAKKIISYINRDQNESQTITVKNDPDKDYIATVVLDAGHGGEDTGIISGTNEEKDITLSYVALIGQILEDNDVHVEYTRTGDHCTLETSTYNTSDGSSVTDDSRARAEYASEVDADYCVSIHMDCMSSNPESGYAFYVHQGHPDTIDLARYIDERMSAVNGLTSLGARNGYLQREIQLNTCPAVIIDIGSADDFTLLTDSDTQQAICEAIADGIIDKIEKGILYEDDTYDVQADLY